MARTSFSARPAIRGPGATATEAVEVPDQARHKASPTVIVLCPGGLEHGGGIGRQMSYFLRRRVGQRDGLDYAIVDTRGPWFLGASPHRAAASLLYFLRSIGYLLAFAIRGRVGLLHVNITGRGSTARKIVLARVAEMIGLPYLVHVHDPDYVNFYTSLSARLRPLVRRVFGQAATVLVLGERDRERLSAALALPPERVEVVYNAVPDPCPDGDPARDPSHPCQILFLGYLSQRKGVPELLQALAAVAVSRRDWHATLAGDGPVDSYRAMAGTLGLDDLVSFAGLLDSASVASLCAKGHVLVLPSHAEGLSMTVLEGLSHGLAVIATPVGAHPEVIEHGKSGVFVAPGDVGGLAEAIAFLIDRPDERQRLGVAGRQRFLEKFDIGRYAVQLQDIHARLLCCADRGQPAVQSEKFSR